ncbi:TIGR02391 family protein [Homoserinibacter sp. GY 40078]|uniref:TIGR02391 family protein n=1 Tax=Homoserinibacter sp. GY 40078 TaxID=2603275 RepID=UPI0011CB650D|nr:TIGR02391 family protein [Homoserinibacter sp. GY 40078]TXK19323.1 hypothetical protein FVQ89_05260 [Homoserinibacter sp. GY 40078]
MSTPFDPDATLPDAHMDLLAQIVHPFSARLRQADWPVWGWVQREFEKAHPDKSAAAILETLPTAGPTYPGSKPYGLVWRSDWNTTEPSQNEAVGLTIVGLAYLGARNPAYRQTADELVGVLRALAIAEGQVTVTPSRVEDVEVPLGQFTRDLDSLSRNRPFALAHRAVGRILQREYDTPLALFDTAEGWTVRLRSNGLRRYLQMNTAYDYADYINQADLEARFTPEPDRYVDAPSTPPDADVSNVRPADHDAALWEYVRRSIESEDWDKVAAQVAIFVEDKVRRWSGVDRKIVGHGLYAKALNEGGPLALGAQPSETQGWLHLGMGLAQAVGNVDRHHVNDRDDARQYALGVLGLGSLLLTQIRYEHPDRVST